MRRLPGSFLDTDEASEPGIDDMQRIQLIRDDIAARAEDLIQRLLNFQRS
jgi:hypothetical protein